MKNKKVLITDTEWFESGALKNPIAAFDHELEKYDPTLYCLDYDTRLLATDPPTKAEKESIIYNDYREKYGTRDLCSLDSEIRRTGGRNIFSERIQPGVICVYSTAYQRLCGGSVFFQMSQNIRYVRIIAVLKPQMRSYFLQRFFDEALGYDKCRKSQSYIV